MTITTTTITEKPGNGDRAEGNIPPYGGIIFPTLMGRLTPSATIVPFSSRLRDRYDLPRIV